MGEGCSAAVRTSALVVILRWPKRAIPSFPYGRTSILPSALQRTTFAHAQSANVGQASTNTHEVKSWMASNRQGPIVAAATCDGLIRHYFFEGFEYRLIACFLYFVHGINISVRQIKRCCGYSIFAERVDGILAP